MHSYGHARRDGHGNRSADHARPAGGSLARPHTAQPSNAAATPAAPHAGFRADVPQPAASAHSFGRMPVYPAGDLQTRTTVSRHPFTAVVRRGRTSPTLPVVPTASPRLDSPAGEEHGGEQFRALFERLGTPAPGLATGAEATAVPAIAGGENAESAPAPAPEPEPTATSAVPAGTIRIPDITIPALAAIGKSDTIAAAFTYSGSIARGGAAPRGFGVTRSFSSSLTGTTITPGTGSFSVAATLEHPITYQVRTSTGPDGQVDIASATDGDITAANFATVVSDLTPDMSDLDGRPPRTAFWAEDLTLRHERVHADDDNANGPGAMATVTTWLNGQTAADAAGVTTLLGAVPGRFASALLAALSTEDGEKHAYGDGAPSYTARANAIQTKGTNGDYP